MFNQALWNELVWALSEDFNQLNVNVSSDYLTDCGLLDMAHWVRTDLRNRKPFKSPSGAYGWWDYDRNKGPLLSNEDVLVWLADLMREISNDDADQIHMGYIWFDSEQKAWDALWEALRLAPSRELENDKGMAVRDQ